MRYSAEDLESIADKLRKLPEVQKVKSLTKRQVVEGLSVEIAVLKDRGYTIGQIAEALSGSGLEISTPTLKNYLHRAKRAARKSARKRGGQPRKDARGKDEEKPPRSAASFDPTPDSDDI